MTVYNILAGTDGWNPGDGTDLFTITGSDLSNINTNSSILTDVISQPSPYYAYCGVTGIFTSGFNIHCFNTGFATGATLRVTVFNPSTP
jgi:hypothetical protein